MKSVNWQNGQRIIKQVLDWFSSSKDQNDQEYRQDNVQAGILLGSLNELGIIVGANNTPGTPSVTIRTGIAYDNTGERIYVSDETISYNATKPSDTTDDGRGIMIPTPHSTGSKNVPLIVNSFNYIWADYLKVIDESLFTLQTATNAKQFYKQDNGYQITVTATNVAPTASSVFLGSVNLTGFGVVSGSTISTTGRTYSLIKENRVKIKTPLSNLSDVTTTYGFNQEATLDDHIKAVGSGPVTPQNPHGTTLGDIGVDVETVVANHQKFMHSNGMIGSRTTLVSSLYTEFHAISPGDDFIVIKPLISTEVVNIDGITITSSDVPSDTTFLFSSLGDLAGTYYIYLDKFTKSLVRTVVDPSGDVTKYPVVSMVWTPGVAALYDGNLTSITDLRVFGTINNDKIDNKDEYDVVALHVEDGTVSAPALRWQSDPDTGIYRSGSGIISFTSNGVLSANISGGQISAVDGAVGSPAYSFLNDPTTGFYRSASGNTRYASAGINTVSFLTTGLEISTSGNIISNQDGTSALPSYTFGSDLDTGIYHPSANVVGFTSNGSQSATIGSYISSVVSGFSSVIGSVSVPSYTFTGDIDTGLYWVSSGAVAFTSNGTLTTKLSGSQMITVDGTASVPAYSFINNTNSGIYNSSGNVTASVGGSLVGQFYSGGLYVPGKVFTNNSSAASPSFAMGGSQKSGIYSDSDTRVGLVTNNASRLDATDTLVIVQTPQFIVQTGTVGAPAIGFFGNASTGLYIPTGSTIGFSTGGTERARIDTVGFKTVDGTAAAPSLAFTGDINTGLYRVSSGIIGFTTTGTERARIDTLGFKTIDGTVGNPSLSFTSDPNTGLYHIGADNIGVAVNGTKVIDIAQAVVGFNSISATGTGFNPVAYQIGATNTGWTPSGGNIYGVVAGTEVLRIQNSTLIAWKGVSVGDGVSNMYYKFTNSHYSQTALTLNVANNSDYLYIQVGPNVQIYMDSEFDYIQYTAGSGGNSTHNFVIGGSEILRINSTSIRPNLDNTISCGASGKRWTAVWAANGAIQTSHSSTKANIVDLDADQIEIPRGVLYDRDGRRYLGYLNDTIPDEGRPFTEEGTISKQDNYEQAVIGILCATVRQLKEDNKQIKQQLKDLLDRKE